MTILVFGKTGQTAAELDRYHDTLCLPRSHTDLIDPSACARSIHTLRPTAVINAAAYTNVDRAEQDETRAMTINAFAPRDMAQACAHLNIPFVHLSTDYVFDGSNRAPWSPDDPIAPLNAYGRTKAAGEDMVRAAGGPHVILRTSWVVSAQGSNFVKTMRRLVAQQDSIKVVCDQIGGLTPAQDLAKACHKIANKLIASPHLTGTYHFAGTPDASWADIARAIQSASNQTCIVQDCATSDYQTAARRPQQSRLDCASLQRKFTISRPDWRIGLQDILKELDRAQ